MEKSEFEQAYQYSLRLLTICRRSSRQLRRKLEERGYSPPVVERVVKSLTEQEVLNDEDYARTFLSEELLKRPSGKLKLKYELKRRGIPDTLMQKLLAELGVDYERESAVKIARERAEGLKDLDRMRRRKKIYDFLVRRGFDFQTCHNAVEALDKEAPEEIHEDQ